VHSWSISRNRGRCIGESRCSSASRPSRLYAVAGSVTRAGPSDRRLVARSATNPVPMSTFASATRSVSIVEQAVGIVAGANSTAATKSGQNLPGRRRVATVQRTENSLACCLMRYAKGNRARRRLPVLCVESGDWIELRQPTLFAVRTGLKVPIRASRLSQPSP
jgi:hypothetical protein